MECDDDDEDPHPGAKISLKSYKFYWDDDRWKATLLESEVGNACTWPPTASDLVYLGEEDDDPDYVCEVCQGGPFSPGRAWDAFYDRGYSIRESWCAGSRCKSLAMVDDEEEEEEPSSPSPAIKLSPVNVGASTPDSVQDFRASLKVKTLGHHYLVEEVTLKMKWQFSKKLWRGQVISSGSRGRTSRRNQ